MDGEAGDVSAEHFGSHGTGVGGRGHDLHDAGLAPPASGDKRFHDCRTAILGRDANHVG